MKKTGKRRIKDNWNGKMTAKCASCGKRGVFKVTFSDYWGKLVVTLCEDCSDKPYESLRLQSRLNWPTKN